MLKTLNQLLITLILISFLVGIVMMVGGTFAAFNPQPGTPKGSVLLNLTLDGVIMDGSDFIETLAKYRKRPEVKGVLITINSPGGVVGPSQEIYREIQRTSREFKKPVYVYCRAVAASGAYYAAVGADRIYTTPGCFMGSIGVIMEFVNLQKLYSWAKVDRFALTTGQFKDTGAEYRPMRADERAYLQGQLQEVLGQFKKAVMDGRHLSQSVLDENADGRVMSGAQAVKLGFADEVGTWEDARAALGEKVGLGKNAEMFTPRKPRSVLEMLTAGDGGNPFESTLQEVFQTRLKGQPLFLFPGYLGLDH